LRKERQLQEKFFQGYTPIASGNQVYLERPRINNLLEKAIQMPMIRVVAGAGYGKTQAVYSFARKINVHTAWLQISDRDNQGECFWDNFTTALSILSRDMAQELRQMEFPVTDEQYERYLKIRNNKIILNERYLVVYDDCHLIKDRAVLRFLEHRITNSLPNICSVLISRGEPALNMERLSQLKPMFRITSSDLEFTHEEMVSYFRLQHVTIPPQMASVIYHDTEGWAFAIHMAALSLRNISRGAAYVQQALRSNTFKLFESEVMAGLSPELRRFLLKLTLIDNHNKDLLLEICADVSLIKEMEGLFSFISYDSALNTYRIHRLFMDYLLNIQNELSVEEKKDVWNKAAIWCAANNREMDAIINCEKAEDYTGIVKVLDSLPLILPTVVAGFILELLERTEESVYRNYPMIAIIRARTLVSLGRYEQCQAELLARLPSFALLEEGFEKHRVLSACNMALGLAHFFLSTNTRRYDSIHFFKTAAEEAALSPREIKPPLNGINLGFHVCRVIDSSPKEMERFIKAAGDIVPCSMKAMGGCLAGMYELLYGELFFYRGEFAEAKKQLLDACEKAEKWQQYEIANRALFYLLRICLCRGDVKGIEQILMRLKAELEEPYFLNRHFYYDIVTGWYNIQIGRKELVAPWLKSDYVESGLNSMAHGLEKLVKAKYYFTEKLYPAALASLEDQADMEIFLMGRIEMKVLEAVCHYRLSDREWAYKNLEEAYSLSSPGLLYMPFAELGKDMRSLVETALRDNAVDGKETGLKKEWLLEIRRMAADYAKKLYSRQSGTGNGGSIKLSDREMDVLIGLSHGLTREEIADSASILPNTVKSVTRSVYSKLGAMNQADAVRIATQRGIL